MAFGASAGGVDNAALTRAKSAVAEAVVLSKQDNGLIGHIVGNVSEKAENGWVKVQRLEWGEGQKFSLHASVSNETIGTVANQAAATAVRTTDPANDIFLSNEFSFTHYADNWDLDSFDMDRIRGGEPTAPAGDYGTNIKNTVAQWILNTLQTDICANTTQARTTLGGLPYIVDDANAYIALRSDATHTNLRSYVATGAGAINLTGNVMTAQTNVRGRGGWPTLGVLPTALHAKLHGQVVSAGYYVQTGVVDSVGAPSFIANNTKFILETGLDASYSGTMFLLNQEDWMIWMSKNGMGVQIVDNPALVSGSTLQVRMYAGTACKNPKRQGKVSGLS